MANSIVRTVITDVDGSLTDGGVYYFRNGVQGRKFNTFDGEGFAQLKAAGIGVYMVTSSSAKETEIINRANWLGVPVFPGIKDKELWLRERIGINYETLAVFGNDLVDLPIMKLARIAGCPDDSHIEVLKYCGSLPNGLGGITIRKGGEGAFREFADYIIQL